MRSEQIAGVVESPIAAPGTLEAEHGTRLQQRWGRRVRQPLLWVEAALGLYILAISVSAMSGPLDRDEGAFLTIARVILHGGVPYRDAFDQKSPGIYYVLAGVLALSGGLSPVAQILVIRALVVLTNFATAAGLVLLGRRWWSLEVGVLGAALWLLSMPTFEGDRFFTEPFAIAATVFALVAIAYYPTVRGALCAGLLLALGSLFKQTTALAVPGVALLLLPDWRAERGWWRPSRALLARAGAFAAGLIAPWMLVCAAFALAGAFGPMWQQVVVSNITHYPADGTLRSRLELGLGRLTLLWVASGALGLAGLARWAGWWPGVPPGRRGPAPSPPCIALWIIMALACIPFATHSYPHYWLQLLPSAVFFTALATLSLLDQWRPVDRQKAAHSVPMRLLAPALLAGVVIFAVGYPLPPKLLRDSARQLQGQADAGQVIAAHTTAGSRIFVMPAEAEYYYLADRTPATATIYVQAINITPALVSSIEADIDAERYSAVVWVRGAFNEWSQNVAIYHEITTHYHLVATDQAWNVEVWLPNDAPS